MNKTETSTNIQIHPIQRRLLFNLLFEKSMHFAELKPYEMEGSQFMFHMRQLIDRGFVSKRSSTYKLTTTGKEFANKIDVFSLDIAMYPKTTTILCCTRKAEDADENEYLLYKRLKNPFYGCYGFPTQKVLYGETLENTAIKGLKEETGLIGTPKLLSILHYHVHSQDEELLEDKIMYAYLFENPTGVLVPHIEGEYFWVKESKIESVVIKPQEEFWEVLSILKHFKNEITFKEISVKTKNF